MDNTEQEITQPQEKPAETAAAQEPAAAAAHEGHDPQEAASAWKAESRKWESRAKANKTAAEEAAKGYEARIAELEAANNALKAQQERAEIVRNVAKASGLSEDAVALLKGTTEEELSEQVSVILAARQVPAPRIPEASMAEPAAPAITREQVLAVKDPVQRIRAIAQNRKVFEQN